jgi:hypothetical protein
MLQFQIVLSKGLYTWNLVDDALKVVAESKLFVKDKATLSTPTPVVHSGR